MKKILTTKNTVTSLLVTFIYASNLVSTVPTVNKIIATIAIFVCSMMCLENMDRIYIENRKSKRKGTVKEDVQNR